MDTEHFCASTRTLSSNKSGRERERETREMLIINGDYPMAYGALDLDRDLTQPVQTVRSAEPGVKQIAGWPDSETMATLPEMRRGAVAAALVKVVGRIRRPENPLWGYRTGEIAHAAAKAHLAYYRVLETKGEVRILLTGEDFTSHMRSWSDSADYQGMPVGMVIGMEGADPVLWPEQVHQWWEDGVRVISLSHYGVSTYSHGTGTGVSGGLFPEATPLLREMESLGIILDVTHMSDESTRQALDIFSGPVLASHQNCRALVPGERQFSDAQLIRIIERGAVVGASMDTWMLYRAKELDWGNIPASRRDVFPREAVTLDDLADHIDHVCQLAGDSRHSAIGGDTDGQGGRDGAPYEIDTVADYQKLAGVLAKRGYSEDDVSNVMYRNWQRFYEKWLPGRT